MTATLVKRRPELSAAVCGFDPGLDTRIRGAASPEKPSVFVRTQPNRLLIIFLSTLIKHF